MMSSKSILFSKNKKYSFAGCFSDVKDRSILKIVQLNSTNLKQHVSFKEPEIERSTNDEVSYQRLSRPTRTSTTNETIDETPSRSRSEPRRDTTPTSLLLKYLVILFD